VPAATEQATAASPAEPLSARAEVLVEQFADESYWARRGRGTSLYFSKEESSTATHVGTAALGCPAEQGSAISLPAKMCRASLDRTAEGGCPHVCHWVVAQFEIRPFPAASSWGTSVPKDLACIRSNAGVKRCIGFTPDPSRP